MAYILAALTSCSLNSCSVPPPFCVGFISFSS
jgi:hypothetical protein